MPRSMKAAIVYSPGGPDVIKIEQRPVPAPGAGELLIRIEAFGINRSELFTRQGHSPNVSFPRILGIEAVGTVAASPDGLFEIGQQVATVMGGMGRRFDGGYAEYVVVPSKQARSFHSALPWETIGALPEMLQTAWGALFRALRLAHGDRLLIRGGTTSVGLAAIAIARNWGARIAATSRNAGSEPMLRALGAEHFYLDEGAIAQTIKHDWAGGSDKILELIGTTTLTDSLAAAAYGGTVCMAGMVGNRWEYDHFAPMDVIPTGVSLTTYSGDVSDFLAMPLQDLMDQVASGTLPICVGRVFTFDQLVEAHRLMENNEARGKIVIRVR